MLDFSSEIEFDERFDQEAYFAGAKAGEGPAEGPPRIDRTVPAQVRPNTKVQRRQNRDKLFEAYKK